MTAKEKRYVRKLEIRIEELERHFDILNSHDKSTFMSLFEARCAVSEALETIEYAAECLREVAP